MLEKAGVRLYVPIDQKRSIPLPSLASSAAPPCLAWSPSASREAIPTGYLMVSNSILHPFAIAIFFSFLLKAIDGTFPVIANS